MEEGNFTYDVVDLNNPTHVECLKKLWHDPEVQRWTNRFHLYFEDYLTELLQKSYALSSYRIISLNNKPLGYINSDVDANTKTLYIHFIVLLEEYRGKGFGKAVHLDYIDSLKAKEVRVEIHESNLASRALAASLGFEEYKKDQEEGNTYYKLDVDKINNMRRNK